MNIVLNSDQKLTTSKILKKWHKKCAKNYKNIAENLSNRKIPEHQNNNNEDTKQLL